MGRGGRKERGKEGEECEGGRKEGRVRGRKGRRQVERVSVNHR